MEGPAPNETLARLVPARGVLSPEAAAHLSHEFRSSLHTILGYAELLEEKSADDEARENVATIRNAAVHLGGICDDVVDVLKLPCTGSGAESVPLVPDPDDAPWARSASERSIPVSVAATDGIERARIDPMLQRVVSHVIEEVVASTVTDVTISYTSRSTTTCTVTIEPLPANLSVADNGILALAALLLAVFDGSIERSDDRLDITMALAGNDT